MVGWVKSKYGEGIRPSPAQLGANMFDVTLTVGLGPAKDPVVFEWGDVSKVQAVADLEQRLVKALLKLNSMSQAIIAGTIPAGTTTNPVEMTIEFLVTEDGAKWHRTVLEYPKMGEEQQSLILGMLTGELSGVSKETKAKAKPAKAKGKGPK
jgi:hypothetical protein